MFPVQLKTLLTPDSLITRTPTVRRKLVRLSSKGRGKAKRPYLVLLVPLILVSLYVFIVYYPRGPAVYSLPDKIPSTVQDWMSYVPISATYVKFINYTAFLGSPGAPYAIQNPTVIHVYDTNYSVTIYDVYFTVDVAFSESSAATIIRLTPPAYSLFLKEASARLPSTAHDGYIFYDYRENGTTSVRVHTAFLNGYVVQAVGGPSTFLTAESLLATHDQNRTGFFTTTERQAELYVVGKTESEVLGFSVLPNETLVGTHEWFTAVYNGVSSIDLVNFYAYPTQDDAVKKYSAAQDQLLVHSFATTYIIGSFIVQVRTFPWNQAATPINGL
jgi:hypothetical protein